VPRRNPPLDAAHIVNLREVMRVLEDSLIQAGAPEMAEFLLDFVGDLKPDDDPDLRFFQVMAAKYHDTSERATGMSEDLREAIWAQLNEDEWWNWVDFDPDGDGDFIMEVDRFAGFGEEAEETGDLPHGTPGYRYGPMMLLGRGSYAGINIDQLSRGIVQRMIDENVVDPEHGQRVLDDMAEE